MYEEMLSENHVDVFELLLTALEDHEARLSKLIDRLERIEKRFENDG